MLRAGLLVAFLTVAGFGLAPCQSSAESLPVQLIAAGDEDLPGEPPPQKQIELAYRECLKEIDAELAAAGANEYRKGEHRKAEQAACDSSRRHCIERPRTADCRGFVEDYAPSGSE